MPKAWTGKVIGIMHCGGISQAELAEKLDITEAYLSMILNSKREPPNIEQRIKDALKSIQEEKRGETE